MDNERLKKLMAAGVSRELIDDTIIRCQDDAFTAELLMLLEEGNYTHYDAAVQQLIENDLWDESSSVDEDEVNEDIDYILDNQDATAFAAVGVQYMATALIMRKLFYTKADILKGVTVEETEGASFDYGKKEEWKIFYNVQSYVEMEEDLDALDFAILDVIYTLRCNGISVFSTKFIDALLSGNPKRNTTQKSIERIEKAIAKMGYVYLQIVTHEEEREAKQLLAVTKLGNNYHLLELNDLYTLAEEAHQIANVPAAYLDTTKLPKEFAFVDTEDAIVIKRRVIARVERILKISQDKRKKITNWNRLSLIQKKDSSKGLFAELGLLPNMDDCTAEEAEKIKKQWRTKQKPKYIQAVKGTLENLKRNYAILDYEEHKDNDSKNPKDPVTGYDIICFNKTEKAALTAMREEQKGTYVQKLLEKRSKEATKKEGQEP